MTPPTARTSNVVILLAILCWSAGGRAEGVEVAWRPLGTGWCGDPVGGAGEGAGQSGQDVLHVRGSGADEGEQRGGDQDHLVLRSAEQFKALGHPIRHRMVNVLRQRPATLRQLATVLGLVQAL